MKQEEGSDWGRGQTWESPRGSLVVTQPVLGVMLFTYRGYMTVEVVPFIERSVDGVLARGLRPDLFIDLERMTGYESAYRKAVSLWGAKMYRHFGDVRVLVKSKLVAMGIAVSNLTAANKLEPTTSRVTFQAHMDAAIGRRSNGAVLHGASQ
jgi:hypothetical protein